MEKKEEKKLVKKTFQNLFYNFFLSAVCLPFMETHSRPLEAVGLHDRLKGCESENRPRRPRSAYSKSADFERLKTSTICKKKIIKK